MTYFLGSNLLPSLGYPDIESTRRWAENKGILRSNYITKEWLRVSGLNKYFELEELNELVYVHTNKFNELEYKELPFVTVGKLIEKGIAIRIDQIILQRSLSNPENLIKNMVWFRFYVGDSNVTIYSHTTAKNIWPEMIKLLDRSSETINLKELCEYLFDEEIMLLFSRKGNAHLVSVLGGKST